MAHYYYCYYCYYCCCCYYYYCYCWYYYYYYYYYYYNSGHRARALVVESQADFDGVVTTRTLSAGLYALPDRSRPDITIRLLTYLLTPRQISP